ncbi:MAG: hypothetical protein ACI865_002372 [Flavobacteriaceae bacterium]|jgi:hypothetical protein
MMKFLLPLFLGALSFSAATQTVNTQFSDLQPNTNANWGIMANALTVAIKVQTVYRAKPDGYHILFTTSFIGKDVEAVELKMNKKIDSLIGSVEALEILPKDVLTEVTSLDPIFETNFSEQSPDTPMGYKITQNINFNIADFRTIRYLAKICMEFKIYDIVYVKPYIFNADVIYDTLAEKSVQILDFKKELSKNIGHAPEGGKVHFTKYKNVIYPSDSYLRSQIRNSRLYMHNINQNSEIDIRRNVQTNSYQELNLTNADYVFNPHLIEPAIEFYYQIHYNLVHPPEKKDKDEEEKDDIEKIFYILDGEGQLKKIEFD